MRILLYDNDKSGYNFGKNESVSAHEIGHALGLAHASNSDWNLMYNYDSRYDNHHVIGPTRDDINGIISLYGLSINHVLSSISTQYSAVVNQPAGAGADITEVQVTSPFANTWAFAYDPTSTSLPGTAIVLPFQIDAATFYRGAIGFWASSNPTDILKRIAIAELDGDGIKFGYSNPSTGTFTWFTIGQQYQGNGVNSMEVVLQQEPDGLHGYFYDYNYGTDSWIGEKDFAIYNGWASNSLHIGFAAWTDSNSNPASDYWMDPPNSVGAVGAATSPPGNCLSPFPITGVYGTYGPGWIVSTSGCGGHYGYTFFAYNSAQDADMMAVPKDGSIKVTGYFLKYDTLGGAACAPGGISRSYLNIYVLDMSGNILASYMAINCSQANSQWYYISHTFAGLTAGQYVKVAFGRTNSWITDYSLEAAGSEVNVVPA
jgi:hypothetical protein